jgi:hypothetical protein
MSYSISSQTKYPAKCYRDYSQSCGFKYSRRCGCATHKNKYDWDWEMEFKRVNRFEMPPEYQLQLDALDADIKNQLKQLDEQHRALQEVYVSTLAGHKDYKNQHDKEYEKFRESLDAKLRRPLFIKAYEAARKIESEMASIVRHTPIDYNVIRTPVQINESYFNTEPAITYYFNKSS